MQKNKFFSRIYFLIFILIGAFLFLGASDSIKDHIQTSETSLIPAENIWVLQYKSNDLKVKSIPPIPSIVAYDFMQKMNGRYLVRGLTNENITKGFDGVYSVGNFVDGSTYLLDTTAQYPKFNQLDLNTYQSRIVMLNNNHLVVKEPNGHYRIYNPEGTKEALQLQISYGGKLDLTGYVDEKQLEQFPETVYRGLSLDYNPYSKQYFLLLELNPLYGINEGKYALEEYPLKEDHIVYYMAVFENDGKMHKHIKIPKPKEGSLLSQNRNISLPQSKNIDSDFMENYAITLHFFPDLPDKVLIDQTYLLDWQKESLQKKETKYINNLPFGTQEALLAVEKLPFVFKYANQKKELGVFSKDLNIEYQTFHSTWADGNIMILYPNVNADGTAETLVFEGNPQNANPLWKENVLVLE